MTAAEPRPGLRELTPYVSPQLEVAARLNTNECPYPLPATFFDELAAAIRDLALHRYPDGQVERLLHELAALAGHDPRGTWVASGSNEVLMQLLSAYGGPGRRAVTFEPTYLLHSRLARLAFTETIAVRLPRDYVLTERKADEAAKAEPNVVFVCSPNNPTGNAQPIAVTRSLAERLTSSLIVVDEAYAEFGGESALPLVVDHPNVVVVRTFSKAFALAGARLGYALTSPDVVDMLQRVRLPYHVSALAQTAGIVALRHRADATRMLADIVDQRERISRELGEMANMRVWPSQANFVLFEPPGDAVEVWRGLLDRGVLVRDLTDVVPGALRVTAGAEHEVDLFLKALKEVLHR